MPTLRKPTTKPCEQCRKPFHPIYTKIGKETRFCSMQCYNISYGRKPRIKKDGRIVSAKIIDMPCAHCQKTIQVKSYDLTKQKHFFCSRICKHAHMRTRPTVTCTNCNKRIRVKSTRLETQKHFYCSKACRAKHIIGKNNPAYTFGHGRKIEYGNNWKSQRRAALDRDSHTCQHCRKPLTKKWDCHVHHIEPAGSFNGDYVTANDLTNLISLCHKCHKKAERKQIYLKPRLL